MESSLYRFILRHSVRQQIVVLLMTVASFPALYGTLELPKRIINDAIKGNGEARPFLGWSLNQTDYLFALSGVFLALVMANGGFKYVINTYKGLLGERMLRRLRYELYVHLLRFPIPRFRKVSAGELIPMITAEVETLGGFIGDALAIPAFQGGTLLVYLVFIFAQDPILGLAAVALYPFQGWLIPRLQRRVNQLGKRRVRALRGVAERVGETVAGIQEVHTHDATRWHRADIAHRLGEILAIRMEIYQRKFFIKFLNNLINQLTPFFFYSIGGYLVIKGELSFGALVAVLAAYKDLASPWKELLDWYQQKEDARIKYEQVVEQFSPGDLIEPEVIDGAAPTDGRPILSGTLTLTGVTTETLSEPLTETLALDRHTAVLGSGAGRGELAALVARLDHPVDGAIRVNGVDHVRIPERSIGRELAHVGSAAHIFTGGLWDNLVYGLRQGVVGDAPSSAEARRRAAESALAGNTGDDFTANWVTFPGADGAPVTRDRFIKDTVLPVTRALEFDRDLYVMGLNRTLDPAVRPDIAERVLAARATVAQRLADPGLAPFVERFDPDRFNHNASVAENLLFGAPVGEAFQLATIAKNPHVRRVLDELELTESFIEAGRVAASTMVEMFADLEPGHEFFQRFSFLTFSELPELQTILAKADKDGTGALSALERERLLAVPFNLISARHRLGLMTPAVAERLVAARHHLARILPDTLKGAIAFFDPDRYNPAATIQENLLFGKLVYGQRNAQAKIDALLEAVANEHGLRDLIIEAGFDEPVGVAGGRLTVAQRQKLALARAMVKRPRMLVLDEVGGMLDAAAFARLVRSVRAFQAGRGLLWVTNRAEVAGDFDHVLIIEDGRVIERGAPEELLGRGDSALRRLMGHSWSKL